MGGEKPWGRGWGLPFPNFSCSRFLFLLVAGIRSESRSWSSHHSLDIGKKSRFMSKTTAVLNTRQTIVFHFVLGYKLGHSCTYRQIALNYRVYSIKATNLKLAPTSNKRPWKENSRSAHPLAPYNYNKINKNCSGQEELVVCALSAPYRSAVPVFLLILFSCWSYWPCVLILYPHSNDFPMTSVRSSYTSHKPLGWLICRCYAVRHVRGNTREFG